ncbi:MAG TPA: alpha/beta hydrolase [Solirubrobacterales bacterium]|nr:alpha/beta hydrolase [Solirubrobacterales bacterium]
MESAPRSADGEVARAVERQELSFDSGGERCAAWFYPAPDERAACVVIAHGFGGVREARLDAYAERFQAAGHAALVFDYRHFGSSSGDPRQLISIRRQLADWRAAVSSARSLDGVDPARIALWGTSYSGGHVLRIAAEDPRIAVAISQVPFMDGLATAKASGLRDALRLTAVGLRDAARAATRRRPYYLPIVGQPGELAAMTASGAEEGCRALFPPDFPWCNEVAARVLLTTALYRPGRHASQVRCPLLVQVAESDAITPPAPAVRASQRAPKGELRSYPGDHFDLYFGDRFERAVADQLDFLGRALPNN